MKKQVILIIALLIVIVGTSQRIKQLNSQLKEAKYYQDKYQALDQTLVEVGKNSYTDDYKCGEFSKEAVRRLRDNGIQASVIIGESPETKDKDNVVHAFVGVWFEPQKASFTKDYTQEDLVAQKKALATIE